MCPEQSFLKTAWNVLYLCYCYLLLSGDLCLQIKIPLSMVDLAQNIHEWKDIESNKEDDQYLGDICFSLRYQTNSGKVNSRATFSGESATHSSSLHIIYTTTLSCHHYKHYAKRHEILRQKLKSFRWIALCYWEKKLILNQFICLS